jgi:uncharacterized membrane protein YraQ (UPF0718 family)
MSWFNFNFHDFAFAFLSVLLEGIPFLLIGSLISGLVDVFISSERLAKMLPKNQTAAIMLSGLLGLLFPMCECGSVVVIRRFIRKGLPVATAITYMLAAPILSPIVALSTFMAFKGQNAWEMTSLRLGMGYLIAVAVGMVVHRMAKASVLQPWLLSASPNRRAGLRMAASPGATEQSAPEQDFAEIAKGASLPRKLHMALQSATADFLDVTFFFVIGVAITSVLSTAVNQALLTPLATNPPIAIASLMQLAAALALCSTSDAFVAATSFNPFPFAAKLGFLVFGPMFDLKLFWMYGILFRRRFIILLSLALFVVIWLICWQVSALGI